MENSNGLYGNESTADYKSLYLYWASTAETRMVIEIFLFGTIFISSVVANSVLIACILRYPDMKTVTNVFIFNMAIADLIFVLTMPAIVYARITNSWMLGNVPCKIVPYMQFVSAVVLLWTMTLISIERHQCIVLPPNMTKFNITKASLYSGLTWVISGVIYLPMIFWFRKWKTEAGLICTIVFPESRGINYGRWLIVPILLKSCFVPMMVLVYNYQKIFKKIISTRDIWGSSCVVTSSNVSGRRQSEISLTEIFVPWPRKSSGFQLTARNELSHNEETRINKHVKAIRVIFLNVIIMLSMWLPITVTIMLLFFNGATSENFFIHSNSFILSLFLAYLNTALNPLLYGVFTENYCCCFKKLWFSKFKCGRRVTIDNTITTVGKYKDTSKTNKKPSSINSISEYPEQEV